MAMVPELQFARCMSARYRDEIFTRCVACTRRWAGDTCRFQGIRYIIRDQRQQFVGISFNEHMELTETCKMEFPTKWNRQLDREHIQRLKVSRWWTTMAWLLIIFDSYRLLMLSYPC